MEKIDLLGISFNKKIERSDMLSLFFASVALFVLITIFFIIFFPIPSPSDSIIIKEEPLFKNKQVSLLPGEQYSYTVTLKNYSNQSTEIHYIAKKSLSGMCIVVVYPTNETACFDSEGKEQGGSNVAFKNSSIFFFQPWMLALKPGWRWSANLTAFGLESNSLYSYFFKILGEEKIAGRNAYKVEVTMVSASGNTTTILWVDKERRVLLKQVDPFLKIEIISAPFTLEWKSE